MSWAGIKNYGFGSRPKEVDDEIRARARGVPRLRWTKEKCLVKLNDIIDRLDTLLMQSEKISKDNPGKLKQETIRDLITMMNKIMDYMRYLYPPVQENVNVNIDFTVDAVIERLKKWKKKDIVVVGEEDE
jgi:hypothetical protein